jgi:hypothetical protein
MVFHESNKGLMKRPGGKSWQLDNAAIDGRMKGQSQPCRQRWPSWRLKQPSKYRDC